MKTTTNSHSWILITVCIVAVIMIFVSFSRKLEGVMSDLYVASAISETSK